MNSSKQNKDGGKKGKAPAKKNTFNKDKGKRGSKPDRRPSAKKEFDDKDSEEPEVRRRGDSKAGVRKGKGRKQELEAPKQRHEFRHEKDEPIRLNKYIAAAGVCSRREADKLIEQGKVVVNGEVTTEMGVKIKPADKVVVDGHEIQPEEFVYILLHKPKNTISTTDDEKDRTTVIDVIENATGKRIYPVGRLDRNTTGLILLTNDGELAHRLMHPSYQIRKVYQVETNMILSDEQLTALRNGVELEDGPARAYKVDRHPVLANVIRMSIIEGRNHQVKRMIDAIGAEVINLKRIVYAGLEIGDLRSGKYRNLTRKEVFELRQVTKILDKKSLKL
ncbi:MAG: rRNA pseudouridine synthase [Balneolia bacterium]|nr:rRNA pseudouridine synthase [Balneolia bacterium]